MVTELQLKKEALTALNLEQELLRHMDEIHPEHTTTVRFLLKSLGNMFAKIPGALANQNEDELRRAMFEYYELLVELKQNLKMTFPNATLFEKSVHSVVDEFPTHYHVELKQWFEGITGVRVCETKQTMKI
jgi:hypothetical protein